MIISDHVNAMRNGSSLEEEGVITECLVKVLDDTETIDFDFQTENVVTKVVFKVGESTHDDEEDPPYLGKWIQRSSQRNRSEGRL